MRRVYLDHNATTPVRPEVLEAMLPYLRERFGNPNSVYALGQEARKAVEDAREKVAALLNAASSDEIVFTSCGSESNALAILGAAFAAQAGGGSRHVVSSAVEHEAVRGLLAGLKSRGFESTEVAVDRHGRVDPGEAGRALRDATVIATVMHSNNEVGTLQPVREIAALCRERGVLFHTDAVQSAGKVPLDVRELGADLLSISGHKINAPKGVGALYVRRGTCLAPVIAGHQEKNRRGGTESVASIVALGVACEIARRELPEHARETLRLRRRLEEGCRRIPGCRVNGHPEERLPGTCHVSFEGLDGHALVVALDLDGVCASSGPACSSGASEPSHVLTAMGADPELAAGSLRLSVGWGSADEDVERLLSVLPGAVERLRKAGTAAFHPSAR